MSIINSNVITPLTIGDRVKFKGDENAPVMTVCQIQQGITMSIWFNVVDGNPTPMQLAAPIECLERVHNSAQTIN